MDWPPGHQVYPAANAGEPVFVQAARPGRGRPRLNTEYANRPVYLQDGNGMLVPAAPAGGQPMYRSLSHQERPASVVIHNTHSPVRHRRGSHGYDDYYDEDWSDYDHSPRRRLRAHSHHASCSRSPSPRLHDPKLAARWKKLEDLEKAEDDKAQQKAAEERKKLEEFEKKEKEQRQREKYKEEEMLEAEKKRRKEEDDKKRKEEWIVEWKREQEEKKKKEEEKKKKEEEEFREKTIKTFRLAGYSEEAIQKVLRKAEKVEKRTDKDKDKHHTKSKVVHVETGQQLMRPTYIKVHRKYMSTDTLDEFDLPWELDADTEYIIIKKWINEHDQDELFRHTAKIREKKARKRLEDTAVELRKENGKLQLVERKARAPGRSRSRSRSWLFT